MQEIIDKFAQNTGMSFKKEKTFVFQDGLLVLKRVNGKIQAEVIMKDVYKVDGSLKGLLEGGTQL